MFSLTVLSDAHISGHPFHASPRNFFANCHIYLLSRFTCVTQGFMKIDLSLIGKSLRPPNNHKYQPKRNGLMSKVPRYGGDFEPIKYGTILKSMNQY